MIRTSRTLNYTLYFTHLGVASIGYIRPDDTYGEIPIKSDTTVGSRPI
jgi:hypothetical protein